MALGVSEQVPTPTKLTWLPETVQMLGEFEVTEAVPSPAYVNDGVKLPLYTAPDGILEIEIVGVAWFTVSVTLAIPEPV